MTNGFTTLIAIGILLLIVRIVCFILKNGSSQNASCRGDCGHCGMGCHSAFSPEKKLFEEAMRMREEETEDKSDGDVKREEKNL